MKKLRNLTVFIFLLFLNFGVSFAQNNSLDGVWYHISEFDSTIYIRLFNKNQTTNFNFPLTGSSQYSTRPMSFTYKNFTTDNQLIKIDNQSYSYRISSPQILVLWENSSPRYYHPVVDININSLLGNWIVYGDEYDIELEITSNTLTLKKGKIQRIYSYSSEGFPNIIFTDSKNTKSYRNYFFFGKDIVSLYIPEENGAYLFQRQNK